jgi:ABC-type sugar transport system substrate-binding protein
VGLGRPPDRAVSRILLTGVLLHERQNPETDATQGGGGDGDSGYTFQMVTHETPGDTFWDKIRAGAEQAAKAVRQRLPG